MFGTEIKKGVVMLAAQTGQYQEWVIEGDDFEQASEDWTIRLEQYFSKH